MCSSKKSGRTYNIFNRFNVKKYTTLYYLLFVMLIMGAFASMAQNDYGMTILGIVAASFSVLFFVQLVSVFLKRDRYAAQLAELVCLFVLSAIITLRVFYIRFEFVEYVFALAGIVLIIVYIQKMIKGYVVAKAENKTLAILVIIFYSSVSLYLISMISAPFMSVVSEPVGVAAFALIVIAMMGNLVLGNMLIDNEKTTSYRFILTLRDRSMVLVVLFLLFTSYMAFTKVELVPALYSDEFPQSYYKLLNEAETGNEVAVDGKFKHEVFKEHYDAFIERHAAE